MRADGRTSGDGYFRGLYRDRERGWIFGVCAGLADSLNLRTGMIRIIAIASLLLFFWPTVLTYAVLTLLIREKPLTYVGPEAEREFWTRSSCSREWRRR